MLFADEEHKGFYLKKTQECVNDTYTRALIYTLGISDITRARFDQLYNVERREINPEQLSKGWQTGSTARLTRLAFNLFTDGVPTAYDDEAEDFSECRKYSVSDIFCCGFAPYFVQAIQIRYPEYF